MIHIFGWLVFGLIGSSEAPAILTSIVPMKFILQEIVAPEFRVESLTSGNVSSHIYEPTPSDVRKLHESQIVFFVDPNLDHWMIKNRKDKIFSMMSLLPVENRKSFIFDHDHSDHAHQSGHHHHHKNHHKAKSSYDPHFWMDPLSVQKILPNLVELLCQEFSKNCSLFKENAQKFSKNLDELDKNIRDSLRNKKVGPIMTTHDFLNYFCQRYNIEYLEPIEPIPGKEPSPKDILKLHRLVKEKNLKVLFSEPQLNTQNAKNLAESAGVKYLDLDPIGADKSIKDYQSLILWNLNQMLAGH